VRDGNPRSLALGLDGLHEQPLAREEKFMCDEKTKRIAILNGVMSVGGGQLRLSCKGNSSSDWQIKFGLPLRVGEVRSNGGHQSVPSQLLKADRHFPD
jgi:hypothetical protein